jgi:predicted nuclease of predicted toxin-antitoxin system
MAGLLRAAGHDCAHVYDLGLGGQPDEQIMVLADRENRILVSADTDFGELLANRGGRGLRPPGWLATLGA